MYLPVALGVWNSQFLEYSEMTKCCGYEGRRKIGNIKHAMGFKETHAMGL